MQNLEAFREFTKLHLKVYLIMIIKMWQGYQIFVIWHWLEWKENILDWKSEYIQNNLQFRVEGTNIEVATLQRNTYFIWKMQDLPCKTLRLFANSLIKP